MNTKDIGDISEAKVISELLSLGASVSIPFGDNTKYDIIADVDEKLIRVQVKTGRMKNGSVKFNTTTINSYNGERKHKSYESSEIDIFAVYSEYRDEVYWVSVEEAPKRHMSIRVEEPENDDPRINYSEDYASIDDKI